MTEPTDWEITQLWNEQQGRYPDPIPFARAVLAKFGTPSAVAGEPEGWITWWPTAPGVHKPVYSHGPNKPSHGPALDSRLRKYPVFTPQPTQAQAVAVPLALHQRDSIKANAWRETPLHGYFDADEIIDAVEAAHGIKGGQK